MRNELEKAKLLLREGAFTLAAVKGGYVFTSCERGVKPLIGLLDSNDGIRRFSAADKVVGKAAAFLYVLLEAEAVYADVISIPALEVLERHKIHAEYSSLTEAIRNRTNTGFCPMETAVIEISEPEKALTAIRKRLSMMK